MARATLDPSGSELVDGVEDLVVLSAVRDERVPALTHGRRAPRLQVELVAVERLVCADGGERPLRQDRVAALQGQGDAPLGDVQQARLVLGADALHLAVVFALHVEHFTCGGGRGEEAT